MIFQIVESIGEEIVNEVFPKGAILDCRLEEDSSNGEGGLLVADVTDVELEICHLKWSIKLDYIIT